MILPMTLTMAAASTLLNIWLGGRVSRMRVVHRVSIGDGGAEPLVARMRAQANFVEWAPFFLILLALIEIARGQPLWLWVLASLFILARILHALGMDRPPGNKLRAIGMMATALIMLVFAGYAIVLVYQDRLERMRPTTHETFAAASAQARAST
ncbi:MAG: hypothetical protein JWO81_2346 [Alphaproteobacteria bacterium]|nr:hypothetical protein [Alphaproteobacteria bacterium]